MRAVGFHLLEDVPVNTDERGKVTMAAPDLIPATEGSLQLGVSRETLIRRIQRGQLRGVLRDGRWFVVARDVAKLARERDIRAGAGAA